MRTNRARLRAVVLLLPVAVTGLTAAPSYADDARVFSLAGDPLTVGSVVAQGATTADGTCSFADAGYRLVAGTTASAVVTGDCELVIASVSSSHDTGLLTGTPTGGVTPRQPGDSGGAPGGAAIPDALPHATVGNRVSVREAFFEHWVTNELKQEVFKSYDEFTFTRDLDNGDLGNAEYVRGYCAGAPSISVHTPYTVPIDAPFENEVTECSYVLDDEPTAVDLTTRSGYTQSTTRLGNLVGSQRARFIVWGMLSARPDTDFNFENDSSHGCGIAEGQLPIGWTIRCAGLEREKIRAW